ADWSGVGPDCDGADAGSPSASALASGGIVGREPELAALLVPVPAVFAGWDLAEALLAGVIVETSAANAAVSTAAPPATQRRVRESLHRAASRSRAARTFAGPLGTRGWESGMFNTIRQLHQLSLRAA
ncbi:MAG: hypothetical protein ACR2JH_03625, partial [Solirubrobacteraceae bacterium]